VARGRAAESLPPHTIKNIKDKFMIALTKLDGKEILINEQLIETAYETPDTIILMNNGHTYIVAESLGEIMKKIVEFRRVSRRRLGGNT
jgi:flagellar protein FlbD